VYLSILGGVDGLIHITDLSWGRVNHPEEIVQLDQKLNVVILDFDDDKKRIALGLKQLTSHPWDSLSETLKIGDQLKVKLLLWLIMVHSLKSLPVLKAYSRF
jgi:small subunit ribosomal protein S1